MLAMLHRGQGAIGGIGANFFWHDVKLLFKLRSPVTSSGLSLPCGRRLLQECCLGAMGVIGTNGELELELLSSSWSRGTNGGLRTGKSLGATSHGGCDTGVGL